MEKKRVHYKYVLRCSIILVYWIDWGLGKTDSEVQFSPERPCLDAEKSTIGNLKHTCRHNVRLKRSLQHGKILANHISPQHLELKEKKKKKAGEQSNMFQPIKGEASCPYAH